MEHLISPDPALLAICHAARAFSEAVQDTRLDLLPALSRQRVYRLARSVMTDGVVGDAVQGDLAVALREIEAATAPLVMEVWEPNEFDATAGYLHRWYPPDAQALRECAMLGLRLLDALRRHADEERALRLAAILVIRSKWGFSENFFSGLMKRTTFVAGGNDPARNIQRSRQTRKKA